MPEKRIEQLIERTKEIARKYATVQLICSAGSGLDHVTFIQPYYDCIQFITEFDNKEGAITATNEIQKALEDDEEIRAKLETGKAFIGVSVTPPITIWLRCKA